MKIKLLGLQTLQSLRVLLPGLDNQSSGRGVKLRYIIFMDGWMDGWVGGWMGGWVDGYDRFDWIDYIG